MASLASIGLADAGHPVRRQIVHHYDVVRFQGRHQRLFDSSKGTLAVDQTIEDARCGDPIMTKASEKGHCLPVSKGGGTKSPLAAWTAPNAQRNVVRHSGFIDEHQLFRR